MEIGNNPPVFSPVHGKKESGCLLATVIGGLAGLVLLVLGWKLLMGCGGCETKMRTGVANLHALILQYRHDTGHLPPPRGALRTVVDYASGDTALLEDPYGRPYRYRAPAVRSGDTFDIYSVGYDGLEGTRDDIGNWDEEPGDAKKSEGAANGKP